MSAGERRLGYCLAAVLWALGTFVFLRAPGDTLRSNSSIIAVSLLGSALYMLGYIHGKSEK